MLQNSVDTLVIKHYQSESTSECAYDTDRNELQLSASDYLARMLIELPSDFVGYMDSHTTSN
jgi:hypothetical protein